MKAVGFRAPLPIDHPDALVDVELPAPQPGPRDLLVEVVAVSVNPVDTKVRMRETPAPGAVRVLGWDAAGTVRAVGPAVTMFKPGDQVFYAGSLPRAGTNAELHLVDERIVGAKPKSLTFAEAAALPLTAITAWELLFERLGVARGAGGGETLLVIGGAGGVGSILIQLARQLTGLTVVATASRPETAAWCRELGAHEVVDHTKPLAGEMKRIGRPTARYVAGLTGTGEHLGEIVEVLAPQGHFALIDDPASLDVLPFKRKSASIHWEFMFTRPMFETDDMIAQHALLSEVGHLVEAGTLRTTLAETFGRIDAANLKRAHAVIESGRSRGKIVLEGF